MYKSSRFILLMDLKYFVRECKGLMWKINEMKQCVTMMKFVKAMETSRAQEYRLGTWVSDLRNILGKKPHYLQLNQVSAWN